MDDWDELVAAAPAEVWEFLEGCDEDEIAEARRLVESGQGSLAVLELLELLDEPAEQLAAEGRQGEFYSWLRLIS